MPGNGAHGADIRRAAAVVLLIGVAAVGLRAGGALSAAGDRQVLGVSAHVLYWVLAVAELAGFAGGIALLIARLIWARRDGLPPRRRRRSIWWVLLLPLAAFGLSGLIRRLREHGLTAHAAAAGGGHVTANAAPAHPQGNPWPLLLLFAVVALASAALTVYRRRSAAPASPDLPSSEDPVPLAAALAAGERALHSDPDPRTAIIGCYAAMERSLADAGSPPHLADTPAEVLSRATVVGLVRPAWAGALTGLFRRARYSSHPMTEADRAEAIGALAQVRADLGDAS